MQNNSKSSFFTNPLVLTLGALLCCALWGSATPFIKIGYELILPCCCTNGYEGYFPMQEAYDEGGYEARSSRFKAGVAEQIITEGKQLLKEIGEQA